ncbi:hypothetical protein AB1N83_005446 [Pleurotus pulmonarius]
MGTLAELFRERRPPITKYRQRVLLPLNSHQLLVSGDKAKWTRSADVERRIKDAAFSSSAELWSPEEWQKPSSSTVNVMRVIFLFVKSKYVVT